MLETDQLLSWYDAHRRILPWREDPTPYHVWLSEIMLQQTRVEAVKDYYARFLKELPTVEALADADEDTYMKLWQGLGYYSRVRNLHAAAVQVMEDYDGRLPDSSKELQKLKGIGEYTSRAIASICFGEPVAAIDGNLLRVFSRRECYGEDIKSPKAKKDADLFYIPRIPQDRPGDYNQALMDLGATVCLPNGTPLCGECPWNTCCKAHTLGQETAYPYAAPKAKRRKEDRTVFLIHDENGVLLHKRPSSGLLASLYEYPNTDGILSRSEAAAYIESLGIPVTDIPLERKAKHIFSHLEWHMTGYDIVTRPREEWTYVYDENDTYATWSELEDTYSVPSAFSAYTGYLLEGRTKA